MGTGPGKEYTVFACYSAYGWEGKKWHESWHEVGTATQTPDGTIHIRLFALPLEEKMKLELKEVT